MLKYHLNADNTVRNKPVLMQIIQKDERQWMRNPFAFPVPVIFFRKKIIADSEKPLLR